jgi:hypothetical protein
MHTAKIVWLRGAIVLAAIIAPVLLLYRATVAGHAAPPAAARTAVVVELFTSEGCSSCPPADALLGRLRQEKLADGLEVIPLGLHVDYWNFQGWTDRFSSASYSERQNQYAKKFRIDGPYTPQMVVDGAAEFVGSDASRARQAIAQAALRPQAAEVKISPIGEDKLQVQVKTAPGASGSSEVTLAVTEDNLVSKVGAGENSGRELHHAAVVRELRSLGRLGKGGFEAQVRVALKKDWKRENVRIVVFVQDASGRIDGATAVAAASLSGAR